MCCAMSICESISNGVNRARTSLVAQGTQTRRTRLAQSDGAVCVAKLVPFINLDNPIAI